eukprot:COSAG06_NODE_4481_length_4212_cov_2.219305_2_plen_153_part_00
MQRRRWRGARCWWRRCWWRCWWWCRRRAPPAQGSDDSFIGWCHAAAMIVLSGAATRKITPRQKVSSRGADGNASSQQTKAYRRRPATRNSVLLLVIDLPQQQSSRKKSRRQQQQKSSSNKTQQRWSHSLTWAPSVAVIRPKLVASSSPSRAV